MTKRAVLIAMAAIWMLGATPTRVYAGCFGNASKCFRGTTTEHGFWDRFFKALDCELDFVECVRIKVLGL
ncbi:MAG: hypothetical protein QF681_05875 [Vicinamibacterales bacterium]|nr:hypothetical protein [Vicinamibacterales bacterium]